MAAARGQVAAVLVLAIGGAASSDSGGGEPRQPRPPVVAIVEPSDLSLIREPSFEVHCFFQGHVVDITVAIDGRQVGVALRGDEAGSWRLPADRVSLTAGFHEIAATAVGDAGAHTAVARVVHQPDGAAFAMRLVPARLRLFQGDPGLERGSARLLTFEHPSGAFPLEVQLRVNRPGLAADASPSTIDAGDSASIGLDARGAAPGDYQVVVTGLTEGYSEVAESLWVTVVGSGPPTTSTSATPTTAPTTAPVGTPGPPHTLLYEVASTVTASSTDLPATDAEATWQITWPCADGRCDGAVTNGGPRGRVDFEIRYDPAVEAFSFEFELPQPENPNCPTNDVAGTLTPTAWDGAGPVGFDYALDSALRCTTGDVTVSWAGSGLRQDG